MRNDLEGRVIYLLILITLVQFSYPITGSGWLPLVILWQLMFLSTMVAGLYVAQHSHELKLLGALGVAWLVTITIYNLNPNAIASFLLSYAAAGIFQAVIAQMLLRYIFTARQVTRDVLYAAVTVYLQLGVIFGTVYGVIESLTYALYDGQHAFSQPNVVADEIFPWQDFFYFSYATLTTLGYGDIQPVSMWARSMASLEAVTGVLYTTIIVARLVGLYAHEGQPTLGDRE